MMQSPQEIMIIRQLDRDLALAGDRLHSRQIYQHSLWIPDEEHRQTLATTLDQLRRRVDQLTDDNEVSHFFIHHFHDVLDFLTWEAEDFWMHPQVQLGEIQHTLKQLWSSDQRRRDLRLAILSDQWTALPTCLQALERRFPELDEMDLPALLSRSQALQRQAEQIIPQLDAQATELKLRLNEGVQALSRWIEQLREAGVHEDQEIKGEDQRLNTDPESYRRTLAMKLGVKLDDLLSWYQEEIEATRANVFAIANRLSETPVTTMTQVRALLDEKAGACKSAEEMFRRGHEYLARVKAVSKQKLWHPIDELCDLTDVPEELRESFPWGGYMDGCPYERPLHGRMFLNETNYTAVSDGWIKVNTIHEAYFGHHIQFLRVNSDPLPETMRRGPKADPLIEGTAHRSEHVYESIFAEDPYFPLFTAYRRHHTSVRIQADLMLRWENRTIGEVVELYQRELGFDAKTARGQVLAQEEMFGYFTCYCYGLKKIEQLEKELGLPADEMTRRLFEAGQISMESLRILLNCSDEARWSILHDYPSLYRFA